MAAGDKYIVTANDVRVRETPGIYGKIIGALYRNDRVTESERQDIQGQTWIHHETGWTSSAYLQQTKLDDPAISDTTDGESTSTDSDGSGYRPSIDNIFELRNDNVDESEFVNIKSITGVLGLPYQFLPNTDPRLVDSENSQYLGYEYAQRIIEKIPLLFLSPGKASFMTRYSKKEKKSILEKFLTLNSGGSKKGLDDLLDKAGRYYTFEYDTSEYYKIVNPMCRIAARYLGIQDVIMNGTKLDNLNWANYTSSGIRSLGDFGSFTSIPFYLDSETSISESITNSTTDSMISSGVNSVSDYARELRFLLGKDAGVDAIQSDSEVMQNLQNVQDMIGRLLGGNNFLSALTGHLTTVAAGGKLLFPEIWSDSSFSRNYSCNFKFISPDPSPLSVYLNILVPLFHLMALVGARAVPDNPNGYTNPFLVRAIYKGFFNVDTGIITDMSITKGAECQWTPEGVPTSMDVSITIKDLYNNIALSATKSEDWSYDTMNNTALMDYIANLCGVNAFSPEITRILDMWYVNNFENRVRDFFSTNIFTNFKSKISNVIINDIFRR